MSRNIRKTTGLLAAVATLSFAAAAVALPIEARVGSGDSMASVVVQFDGGDKYLFEVRFESSVTTTGLDLMKTLDAEVVGFDIALLDFGFGEFVDGVSYMGHDNSGFVPPDGWWHYWTGDAANGEWTESQVGAGDRVVSDGDWDGWRWGSAAPPSLPPGAAVPLLGVAGQLLLTVGLALAGAVRLRRC